MIDPPFPEAPSQRESQVKPSALVPEGHFQFLALRNSNSEPGNCLSVALLRASLKSCQFAQVLAHGSRVCRKPKDYTFGRLMLPNDAFMPTMFTRYEGFGRTNSVLPDTPSRREALPPV